MLQLKFDCGCSFKCEEPNKIIFSPKIQDINLECKKTWNLISDGNTKGVFQLESRLGQSIAKKLKPENIEQLSALISILRPGSLEAIRDGKSVTNHYIDKKNAKESVDFFHPSLEPILNTTLGELIYQEQAIQIAKDIAGFTLSESDTLRKSIGKKDVKLMAEIKNKFLDGCRKQNIVNENDAQEIFGWIEKSQRYSFNKSILDTTIVISENGPISIKDLNIGDKILSPDLNNDTDTYVKVINKYDHGEQEVFEITTEDGNSITCTMEHKFLCNDGFVYPLSEILLNNLEIICI
jgi:DNA polymerase-3 subunit alpha